MNDIFKRDLNGEMVSPTDAGYDELITDIFDTMKTATEMNTGYKTPAEGMSTWDVSSVNRLMKVQPCFLLFMLITANL